MTRSRTQAIGALDASLSRRKLLLLGTTGVLSVALLRSGNVLQRAEASAQPRHALGTAAPLSVGFSPAGLDHTLVIDAGRLESGDTRLVGEGARFKILGLYPANDPAAHASLDWLTIDISYAPYHDTPFMAWSFRNGPVPRSSSPFTVTVPVEESAGLNLLVSYRLAGAVAPVESTIRFAAGRESGTPKLAEGVYLIALPDAHQALPDWQQYELLPESLDGDCDRLCLYERLQAEYVPVQRPYVAVSIS